LLAITLLGALGITLFPLALGQAREFIHHLPQWMDSGKRQLNLLNSQFKDTGFPFSTDVLSGQINDRLQSQLRGLTGEAVNVPVITLTSLLDLLLTLVLAFYLLLHGEEIWNSLMEWLPASIRQPLSNVLRLSF
jgi:predicted PurR-regulated permease PerM